MARVDPLTTGCVVGCHLQGRYHIDRQLGEGGFGRVFLAHDQLLDRPVAIKIADRLDDRAKDRFRREARLHARLKHPACVRLLDVGELETGAPYLVLDYVPGRTLAQVLGSGRVLSLPTTLHVVGELLDALHEAHGHGIVHRDIKPANILLIEKGDTLSPRLIDFGIARPIDPDATELTVPGTLLGTPRYIAPEQARGEPVDHRTDLYAVGVLLFELLAGTPPFDASDAFGLAVKHITAPPPPLPAHVDPALARLVHCAMAKRPDERPESAAAMARSLRDMTLPRVNRHRWAKLPLPVGAAAALATLFVTLPGPSPTPEPERAAPAAAAIAEEPVASPGPSGTTLSTSPELPTVTAETERPLRTTVTAAAEAPRRVTSSRDVPVSGSRNGRDERVSRMLARLDEAGRECRCVQGRMIIKALEVIAPELETRRIAYFAARCGTYVGGCSTAGAAVASSKTDSP